MLIVFSHTVLMVLTLEVKLIKIRKRIIKMPMVTIRKLNRPTILRQIVRIKRPIAGPDGDRVKF